MLPKAFIFYGLSGSGKGTQAEMLESYLKQNDTAHGVAYLSTGKGLRDFSEKDSHTSALVKDVLGSGGLLPSFLPIWVWTNLLIEYADGKTHIILDGAARREQEAPVLENALSFYNFENIYVILLSISRDEATKRLLKRGRSDDSDEEIKNRLDWYETEVEPAVAFFKKSPGVRFLDIDGEQSVEEIHQDIVKKIS